jgi:Transglycosylase-like domain
MPLDRALDDPNEGRETTNSIGERYRMHNGVWELVGPAKAPVIRQGGYGPGRQRMEAAQRGGEEGLRRVAAASPSAPDAPAAGRSSRLSWEQASPLIQHYESEGGKNIPNRQGSGAFGPWQIIHSTWNDAAPKVGVSLAQYPNAASAPPEVQERVAKYLYETRGFQPWADFNPWLAKAIGWQGGQATNVAALGRAGSGGIGTGGSDRLAQLGEDDQASSGSDESARRLARALAVVQATKPLDIQKPEQSAAAAAPEQPRPVALSPVPIPAAPNLRGSYRDALSAILGGQRRSLYNIFG